MSDKEAVLNQKADEAMERLTEFLNEIIVRAEALASKDLREGNADRQTMAALFAAEMMILNGAKLQQAEGGSSGHYIFNELGYLLRRLPGTVQDRVKDINDHEKAQTRQ